MKYEEEFLFLESSQSVRSSLFVEKCLCCSKKKSQVSLATSSEFLASSRVLLLMELS